MIPAKFEYVRPNSVSGAQKYLETENSVILAGGHSLMTDLKWRKTKPSLVVDINNLPLNEISIKKSELIVGATVRQERFYSSATSPVEQMLQRVCHAAGDPLIRSRGTLVGALCAAEKGGDWGAAALALNARLLIAQQKGEIEVPYAEWLSQETSQKENELVLAAIFPELPKDSEVSYSKAKHAAIGWAIAGMAIVKTQTFTRIAVSGVSERPARLIATEEAISSGGDLDAAWKQDVGQLSLWGDSYASASYRLRVLKTAVERTPDA